MANVVNVWDEDQQEYVVLPRNVTLSVYTDQAAQTASGTFTFSAFVSAGYFQTARISCGFVPDVFCIYMENDTNSGYLNMNTAVFAVNPNCRSILESSVSGLTGNTYIVMEQGDPVTVKAAATNGTGIPTTQTFRYLAYKFT